MLNNLFNVYHSFVQVLYSCKAGDTNEKQFELVKKDCQKKKACQIDVSREFFGNSECPGTDDSQMSLWLVYSCDGGGTDRSKSSSPKCDGSNDITTRPPTDRSDELDDQDGNCKGNGKKGKKKQLDIPGCGGWVAPDCKGGCLNIHKVLTINFIFDKIVYLFTTK